MSRRAISLATLLVCLFSVRGVNAESDDRFGPRHALSIHPLALTASGVAVQYENYFAPPRWSIATSVGYRAGSEGSFSSRTVSSGIELRFWAARARRFARLPELAMVGPFAGARADVSWTMVTHRRDGRFAGSNRSTVTVLLLGVRLPAYGRVELTPSVGVGVRDDYDPTRRLAGWLRPVVRGGLTLGALF